MYFALIKQIHNSDYYICIVRLIEGISMFLGVKGSPWNIPYNSVTIKCVG